MPTNQRPIANSDLWSAIRGLGMYSMPLEDLSDLVTEHANKTAFASRVIASAARQVLATRRKQL